MKLTDIHLRDPFILAEDGKYYLYGSRGGEAWGKCTGLDVYVSEDLEDWSQPIVAFTPPPDFWSDTNFWAPEVHNYKGKYYMFVSFISDVRDRGTQILIADSPLGPFVPHSDGPVTPAHYRSLDGTLYIDDKGVPYMIFCHEHRQVVDGEMCWLQLSDDLKEAVGEPQLMFTATEPIWSLKNQPSYITDGPFVYRTKGGKFLLLWSSFSVDGYVEAIAYSDNNQLDGKWIHCEKPLYSGDGGHGMVFTTFDGRLMMVLHTPNGQPNERPKLIELYEEDDMLYVK
ncbi:MAG: family 43 glycosylhydrolase [Firmicutes bacterium]|nr:family 43 glycosylhydrolase [Bacillota bacterium]